MEDLKTMLDKGMPIEEIKDSINKFFNSAYGYPDKLSLVFAMFNILRECSNLLHSIDKKDFTSQIIERINEIEKQTKVILEEYHAHLNQNDTIINVLSNNDTQVKEMQKQIHDLLLTYDGIIEKFVDERKRMSLQELSK